MSKKNPIPESERDASLRYYYRHKEAIRERRKKRYNEHHHNRKNWSEISPEDAREYERVRSRKYALKWKALISRPDVKHLIKALRENKVFISRNQRCKFGKICKIMKMYQAEYDARKVIPHIKELLDQGILRKKDNDNTGTDTGRAKTAQQGNAMGK